MCNITTASKNEKDYVCPYLFCIVTCIMLRRYLLLSFIVFSVTEPEIPFTILYIFYLTFKFQTVKLNQIKSFHCIRSVSEFSTILESKKTHSMSLEFNWIVCWFVFSLAQDGGSLFEILETLFSMWPVCTAVNWPALFLCVGRVDWQLYRIGLIRWVCLSLLKCC